MSSCPHCGKPTTVGASFCAGCGATLATGTPVAAAPATPAAIPAMPAAAPQARPPGVTLIGIGMLLAAGLAGVGILFILFMMFLGASIFGAMESAFPFGLFGVLGAAMAIVWLFAAIFLAAFVALGIATGLGILKGKSWAWVVTLVLAGLTGLNGIGGLASGDFEGAVGIVVAALVIWYFFQPDVKRWFGRT